MDAYRHLYVGFSDTLACTVYSRDHHRKFPSIKAELDEARESVESRGSQNRVEAASLNFRKNAGLVSDRTSRPNARTEPSEDHR